MYLSLCFRLFLSVKLMFAISLFISYGLQFYVPVNIMWPFIAEKLQEKFSFVKNNYVTSERIFRIILVILICKFIMYTNNINHIIGSNYF